MANRLDRETMPMQKAIRIPSSTRTANTTMISVTIFDSNKWAKGMIEG